MIKDSKSLKEVWEWKEKAYQELNDCTSIEEKIKKRLQLIKKNVKIPEQSIK